MANAIFPPDQRLAEDKEDCGACLHRVLHPGIRLYSFSFGWKVSLPRYKIKFFEGNSKKSKL